ncbi:hypothetical protein [Pedobacter sp. Leaf132]|uniref:hypothetical protein n=1 Tax=Pedobacter sp. Leaf132 TaxID=2876557 RepID=UPI001E28F544|nr:hypothetical protein [Pedobacter sp. Leaf132]
MAFRKEIFQKLRVKHKNVSKSILDKAADYIEKGVNEETEVDDAVEDAEGLVTGFFSIFQSEGDRRASEAAKGVNPDGKKDEGKKDDDDPANPQPGKDDKETPAWAKQLIESNKTLTDRLAAIEQGKTVDSRKQALETKLKGVDEKFSAQTLKNFGRMKFDTDEEFERFLEEIETDAAEFTQNLSDKSLSQQTKPKSANAKVGKEASDADINAAIGNMNI